jgi:hypothetical protein
MDYACSRDHPFVKLPFVTCRSKATGKVSPTHRSLKDKELSSCRSDVTGPIPRSISLHNHLHTERADQCQKQSTSPKRTSLPHRPNEEVIEPTDDKTLTFRSSQKVNDEGHVAAEAMMEYDKDGAPSKKVSVDEQRILAAVLDKFRAYIRKNGKVPEEVTCHVDFRQILSTSQPGLHLVSGCLWYTPVQFRYNIEAAVATLPFVMFENGLIDVRKTVATSAGLRDLARYDGYCEHHVCIALPLLGFGALCQKIKDDTGFEVDYNETFRLTQDCSYVTTIATVSSNKAPQWIKLRETATGTNVFVPDDIGPLSRVYDTGEVDTVSIGLLGIAPSLTFDGASAVPVPPGAHPRIRFRVAAIRAMMEALPTQMAYFTFEDRKETPENERKPASGDWTG